MLAPEVFAAADETGGGGAGWWWSGGGTAGGGCSRCWNSPSKEGRFLGIAFDWVLERGWGGGGPSPPPPREEESVEDAERDRTTAFGGRLSFVPVVKDDPVVEADRSELMLSLLDRPIVASPPAPKFADLAGGGEVPPAARDGGRLPLALAWTVRKESIASWSRREILRMLWSAAGEGGTTDVAELERDIFAVDWRERD